MKKSIFALILVLFSSSIVACANPGSADKQQKSVARSAAATYKDFKGKDFASGKEASLSEYISGKTAVIDFWASWCGPCRQEIESTLVPLYDKYKDNPDVVILGVDVGDKEENHAAAVKQLGIKYPQLIDTDEEGARAYNLSAIPFIIVVNSKGEIVGRNVRGEAIEASLISALVQ